MAFNKRHQTLDESLSLLGWVTLSFVQYGHRAHLFKRVGPL